jgi:hypothetical protein
MVSAAIMKQSAQAVKGLMEGLCPLIKDLDSLEGEAFLSKVDKKACQQIGDKHDGLSKKLALLDDLAANCDCNDTQKVLRGPKSQPNLHSNIILNLGLSIGLILITSSGPWPRCKPMDLIKIVGPFGNV